MRIIGRTLIILAAASLVVGIAYGLSTTTWGESLLGGGMPDEGHEISEGFEDGAFNPDTMANMPERGDRPDFEGGEHGGGFNLDEILKNLAVVGAITTVIVGVTRLAGRVKKLRKRRTVPEAAT